MSRLVSRILLSMFMFPLGGLVYIFTSIVGEETFRNNGGSSYTTAEVETFILSGLITWVGVALYWCLLWRASVKWDGWRIRGTLIAAGAALALATVVGAAAGAMLPGSDGAGFGTFFGSITVTVAWLIATVFLWRETTAERAQRVKHSSKSAITCPTCGYNLTGLSEARCPECGTKFTLDELIGLQSTAETAEIE